MAEGEAGGAVADELHEAGRQEPAKEQKRDDIPHFLLVSHEIVPEASGGPGGMSGRSEPTPIAAAATRRLWPSMKTCSTMHCKTEFRRDVDEVWATSCPFFQPEAALSVEVGIMAQYMYRAGRTGAPGRWDLERAA